MAEPRESIIVAQHTVQGIEADATGTMSPGWIARILERCRWAVFGRETFVLRDQVVGGVARAAAFEYLEPLEIGDDLETSTWLARVGRTSYDFGHSITRVSNRTVAVRARVTVVHLGPDGPAPLNADLSKSVIERPLPGRAAWAEGERVSLWRRDWIVRPSDQDSFRHVNQARYVDYIDDTRQFAAMAGAKAGVEGRLAALSVEYLKETHAGAHVQMQTWVTGDGARAFELSDLATGEIHSRGQVRARPID